MTTTARSRDPGGKLTLFDLFEWALAVLGCTLGFAFADKRSGWIASAVLGLAANGEFMFPNLGRAIARD